MTTKTLSTFVAAGYTLAAQYDTLDITQSGGVGGTGLLINHLATVNSLGDLHASPSHDGVHFTAGGTIVNGSPSITTASIYGYSGVFAQNVALSVANYGSIEGSARYGDGLFLVAGGQVVNGAAGDTGAYIQGDNSGISAGAVTTVTNFGTIAAVYSIGVDMAQGGSVTNGSLADTAARISSYEGWAVHVAGAAGVVVNFGAIASPFAPNTQGGVYLAVGGQVTNGAAQDTTAVIAAYHEGVLVKSGAASLANFGTISSSRADAVAMLGEGYAAMWSVTNGSAKDVGALIVGAVNGVYFGRYGTVENFGTIVGDGAADFDAGVYASRFGSVTNGSAGDTPATIRGFDGVIADSGFVTNFGTIDGVGPALGDGVLLLGGGAVTNGSAADSSALIEGTHRGVAIGYHALNVTVTNYGTIAAPGGVAVAFQDASDTLIVEGGCAFIGQVLGGGGTLDLDTGAGRLSGLLAGGNVTVSGSMAATTFSGFGTVEIGAAASFATTGAVSLAADQSVIVSGALTVAAKKLANAGTLEALGGTVTVKGAVTGPGHAVIKAGLIDCLSGFSQDVTFVGGAGTLELARSQSYGGTIAGFSTSGGTWLDLADIAFTGAAEATYAGTKSGGVLTVSDGTHTAHLALSGNYLSATFVAASDGHGGVVVHDTRGAGAGPPHPFVAAMAFLGGAGAPLAAPSPWRIPAALPLLAPRAAAA